LTLAVYNKKRIVKRSGEPKARKGPASVKPVFVVHRHLAHQLHYDFRLEVDGVLKSWAVPKGPSMNAADKRLAIAVEDHPLDYKDFKGVIPQGYGAGTVEIWDRGTYIMTDPEDSMKKALKKGHAAFILKGRKLKGQFAIVKTGKDSWLLIKHRDEQAVNKKYDAEDFTALRSPINRQLIEKKKIKTRPAKTK
jgi:bifunctional non-homologous end joining protein LigD